MRSCAVFILLLALVSPAFAAHNVSASQLEQELNALRAKPDAEAAYDIGEMQLTERLTPSRLKELQNELPGEQSRQALWAIADVSLFLDAGASQTPAPASPDAAEQRRIMGLVVAYVGKTIPQLPNFLASRVTTRFEDTPLLQSPEGGFTPFQPLHYAGSASAGVAYQDGKEVAQPTQVGRKTASEGLATRGVFGPILGIVLVDAAQSKLMWSHWEQAEDGVLAVFRYEVPTEKSHYEVDYCCVAEQAGSAAANVFPFHKLAGYHGEMAVDPATGAIRRLTIVADMKTGEPVVKAAILVEYAPVEIGGKTYICPVHSVSTSLAQSVQVDPTYHYALANQLQPLKNRVSDAMFAEYHVFRSDTRVLAETPDASPPVSGTPGEEVPKPAEKAAATAPASGSQQAEVSTPAAAAPASAPVAVAAPVAAQPVPEIAAGGPVVLTDTPAGAQTGVENSGFTLRTTSRLVDVAVVAVDKKGRPVTDLKAGDLEIYDNGRKQDVRFFSQAGNEGPAAAFTSEPAGNAATAGNASGAGSGLVTNREVGVPGQVPAEGNTTVLLIDASHVDFSDLNYAREEMLRFLKKLPAGERMGIYILSVHGFQVLLEPTADHADVTAKLTKWMPSAADLAHAQDEEQRNRQHFDWVHNATDLANVNGNGEGGNDPEMYTSGKGVAAAAVYPPDAELRPLGDRPEDFVLHLLVGVGRHLAAIPGHKMLVWISSDNVLADFSGSAVGREDTGNRFLDSIAMRARETLNEAHVSIYPLDVSQLEAGGVSADLGNQNISQVGFSSRDKSTGAAVGDQAPGNKNGRDAAEMHADTHPIQGAFRDLAAATGGRALRRAGDIAAELDGIEADGRAAYMLGFTPDAQADDKYHSLTVKTTRPGVTLRYRTGYMFAKEPATMMDRIREAVWQPRELNEIALTALPAGNAVKLNVAATDLALAQQGGRWAGKLDIFVVLRDDSALHAAVAGKTMALDLKPETYQRVLNEGVEFDQPLPANPEGRAVRIIVIDETSRRMGTLTIPAETAGAKRP